MLFQKGKINLETKKFTISSNASRKKYKFYPYVNLIIKDKKRMLKKIKNNAGRSNLGTKIIRTKSSRNYINRTPLINYNFKDNRLSFISNFSFLPLSNKFVSTIFMPSGSVTFIPTTTTHSLFFLKAKFYLRGIEQKLFSFVSKINPNYSFSKFTNLIVNLPKNKPVCMLALKTNSVIKYSRSPGSFAKIIKMDTRTGFSLITLPSGANKIFYIYSLGSEGVIVPSSNLSLRPNKAGYYRNLGSSPIVRGVAMNPVDHPHGGRTKSLKYPRTPWGHTTKKKH